MCDINSNHFLFRIMDLFSPAHDFGNVISCCETHTENKRCKQVILVITFILMTLDLVTVWINWKQWSKVGGYSFHHLIFISRTMLLCAAVVGTVLFTTETLTIVVKLFRIHTVKTSDIENPLDERQASPQEINGFCEQQESNVDETEQVKKFDETEKSIKEIGEEQEQKVNEGDKSPPEKLKDENEEQTKELDEGDKSSPGKVREDIGEQDEEMDKGSKSSQVNVREDIEEQDEELDKGNTSSQGNVEKSLRNRMRNWMKEAHLHKEM